MFYKKKGSKYKNKKIEVDGIKFDSKVESERYLYLKDLERKGEIDDLELQPVFTLQDSFKISYNDKKKTQLKIKYIADFMYIQDKEIIVEDVKSPFMVKDVVYKMKKKMMINQQSKQGFDVFREYVVYNKSKHEIYDTWRVGYDR